MRPTLSAALFAFLATSLFACRKEDKEAAKRQTLISDFARKIRQTHNWHRSGQMYSIHDTTYPVNVYPDTTFAVAMFSDSIVEIRHSKVPLQTVSDTGAYFVGYYDPHVVLSLRYYLKSNQFILTHSSGGMGGGYQYTYVSY